MLDIEANDEQSGVRTDPLFGGLTRPPTFLGLPVEVLLAIVGAATVIFLVASLFDGGVAWKIGPLGLGVVMYGIARLMCAHDPRAFRYLFLRSLTKNLHRNREYWGTGSYSPLPNRKRKL